MTAQATRKIEKRHWWHVGTGWVFARVFWELISCGWCHGETCDLALRNSISFSDTHLLEHEAVKGTYKFLAFASCLEPSRGSCKASIGTQK